MSDRAVVTNRLIGFLAGLTAKRVGDHEAPEGGFGPDGDEGYYILYSIPGGSFDGSLANPNEDVEFVYQVSSIGRTREQAEAMRDLAHTAVIGRDAEGAFLHAMTGVSDRRPDGGPGGVEPAGETDETRVFTCAERYVLQIFAGVT